MKKIFLVLLVSILSIASVSAADVESSLSLSSAQAALQQVLSEIAEDIGTLQESYPQLEDWDKARVSPEKIQYQHDYKNGNLGKNGCDLLIYSKNGSNWRESRNLGELKVGVYLKFTATGENAEALKETIRNIVARRFEEIRKL